MARFNLTLTIILCVMVVSFASVSAGGPKDIETKETWWVADDYARFVPKRIAVMPMENLSLEPELEKVLYQEVYARLSQKGYVRISVESVQAVMKEMGVQIAGQLSGISPKKLGGKLNSDALMMGRIDQSGTVHAGVYDALVVSCSLKLVHCETGKDLWMTEQWRTAHRQWQADPINLLLNFAYHQKASRKDRVAFLVQEMLKTLPKGPVQVVKDNLLDQAVPIKASD